MGDKKYGVLSFDYDKLLSYYEDGVTYYPADEWKEATEGVFTDCTVVESWKSEDRKYAKIIGSMVETEEFDFDSPISMDVKDILVFGKNTIVKFKSGSQYYAKLKSGELVDVGYKFTGLYPGDSTKRLQHIYQVVDFLKKEYGAVDYERAHEICVNVFKEKQLDCCSYVKVFFKCIFYVVYPGYYRDGCDCFIMNKEGKPVSMPFSYIFEKTQTDTTKYWKIYLTDIQKIMADYSVSAGIDSNDEVLGVTKEQREFLTTYRMANRNIIVQLKAERFRYEITKDETLMSKVDQGIGKWLYRLGEHNPFIMWMD